MAQSTRRGFVETRNGFDYIGELMGMSSAEPGPPPLPPPSAAFCHGCGMFANINGGFQTCCGACPHWHTAECGQRQAEFFCHGCGMFANINGGFQTCCGTCPHWHTAECGQRQAEFIGEWRRRRRSRRGRSRPWRDPPPSVPPPLPPHPTDATRDAAFLPPEILSLAAQLPRDSGRLDPANRILQAVQMGVSDRAVARGESAADGRRASMGPRGLVARVYVVLVDQYGRHGPWICQDRDDYDVAVGRPYAPAAVSGIFASDAEAIAYLWGSGAEAVLPKDFNGGRDSQ